MTWADKLFKKGHVDHSDCLGNPTHIHVLPFKDLVLAVLEHNKRLEKGLEGSLADAWRELVESAKKHKGDK